MNRCLTPEQANLAADIITEECGARYEADGDRFRQDARASFIRYITKASNHIHEWRFQGALGFGGKFRLDGNRDLMPHVTCYPEDETPARLAMVERANARLAAMMEATKP